MSGCGTCAIRSWRKTEGFRPSATAVSSGLAYTATGTLCTGARTTEPGPKGPCLADVRASLMSFGIQFPREAARRRPGRCAQACAAPPRRARPPAPRPLRTRPAPHPPAPHPPAPHPPRTRPLRTGPAPHRPRACRSAGAARRRIIPCQSLGIAQDRLGGGGEAAIRLVQHQAGQQVAGAAAAAHRAQQHQLRRPAGAGP